MQNAAEVSALDRAEFTRSLGQVFEHAPWVAARTWAKRPFATREELHAALCATVTSATDEEKLGLIRAHPDLVANVALTKESRSEQASAGLSNLSPEEVALFEKCNREYRERFGFPFVICARLNKKEAILRAFPERLKNSVEAERETALREIFKIAELRLAELVAP
ncbi:MAG: 2-oxo-4-hydroxy-4-carboxy-5-ureidoimidazoline decarboxylase [Verrucomicrobiota bacterium]|nr:2-oxo-4-hydroxy-4-carboxy-5-ureidoimidazoline decarboxylase [Verrucomicrobiota bacterium]